MSEEAPKKIEERLHRYAQKRREQGGDFSLHGATRRLLQGEVARRHRRSGKRQSGLLAWFGRWRGRWALGVGAVAVLFLTTWLVWNSQPPGQPMQLARNEMAADGEQSGREQRAQKASAPAAESGKQVALANAPRPSGESRDGVSRTAPSASLAKPTLSLTPVGNPSGGAQAPNFFSTANGAVPATNLFAYTVPKAAGPDNRAASPTVAGVQLAYLDDTKAGQSSPAPTAQPAARLAGGEAPGSARFGVAATDAGALGGNALSANVPQAKEATTKLAVADSRRLAESAAAEFRSDAAKSKTESLALGVNRPAADEALARNRRLNVNQPGAAGGTQSKSAVDSPAAVENVPATSTEAKAKTDVALNLPAQAPGELPRDASTVARFYRQAEPGQWSEVAEMERDTEALKKAERSEAAQVLLGRFTVEQQGQRLRIREPDGSVYEGPITGPVVAASAESSVARDKDALVREKAVTLKSSMSNGNREYSFRAIGSNVTLRQMIVVNGRLSAVQAASAPTAGAAAPATAPLRPALTPAAGARGESATIATNRISRIEGTVRVGAANEQAFKAVRAPR